MIQKLLKQAQVLFMGSWEITLLAALGLGCRCAGICLAMLKIFWFMWWGCLKAQPSPFFLLFPFGPRNKTQVSRNEGNKPLE